MKVNYLMGFGVVTAMGGTVLLLVKLVPLLFALITLEPGAKSPLESKETAVYVLGCTIAVVVGGSASRLGLKQYCKKNGLED
ncbi:MAG: hypothetical protein ACRCYP_01635 [Alphaproteobacteria bacterium]